MKRRVVLHKKVGQTPLEAIDAWRRAHPAYHEVPLSYAGRLDPMAEGVLLMLAGDECKRQKEYASLDKEYVVEVLLGASSDTGDTLGRAFLTPYSLRTDDELRAALRKEVGTKTVPYPAYSSKTVRGVPLFLHALRGTISNIRIPTHEETIYDAALLGTRTISSDALLAYVEARIALPTHDPNPRKAPGNDFRRDEIRSRWRELLADPRSFTILRMRVRAGSGTYMRTLAERIGASLGSAGLALSIERTKVGRYRRMGPLGFWWPAYR